MYWCKDKTDKKDIQICCIGAQIYNYQKYAENHQNELPINAKLYQEMNEPRHVCLVQFISNPLESKLKDEYKRAYIEEIRNNNKSEQELDWIPRWLLPIDRSLQYFYQQLKSLTNNDVNNVIKDNPDDDIFPACMTSPW